jgi:hypothetical protein
MAESQSGDDRWPNVAARELRYHYYPPLEQVREWIRHAGLDVMEEGEGDGYHHFVIRKASSATI